MFFKPGSGKSFCARARAFVVVAFADDVGRRAAQADDHHRYYHVHHLDTVLVGPSSMLRGCGAYSTRDHRFFFPDSPATAWFLTPEERVIAIERIKVNQAGVENKRFKLEQYVPPPSLTHSRRKVTGPKLLRTH